MKLYISIDLEGISGVFWWGDEKEDAKRMTRDLNIVIQTLKQDDIWHDIEAILVSDSHGMGRNLKIGDMEPEKTFLISGSSRVDYMVEGLDASFTAAMFLGYHAASGSPQAVLDHTYSNALVKEVRINDQVVGEMQINAYMAGYYGVPLVLLSGDNAFQQQVAGFYDKDMPYAMVKYGISKDAAVLLPEKKSEAALVQATRSAITLLKQGGQKRYLKQPDTPVTFTVTFKDSKQAYTATVLPGVELTQGTTVSFTSQDYRDAFRLFEALVVLARG